MNHLRLLKCPNASSNKTGKTDEITARSRAENQAQSLIWEQDTSII